jgi:M6 family metalloprotease-like protein
VPIELHQPDGKVINAFASGDEFHNWAHDESNFTIIQDPITGFWCWAIESDGDVVSTGFPIHLHEPSSLHLTPGQNISEDKYIQRRESWDAEFSSRSSRSPSIGVVQSITVFIRFSCQDEFAQPVEFWDEMLNSTEEGSNSMWRYFYDASFEQLMVESPIFPTPDDFQIFSYQCSRPREYYMPFSAMNPIGYQGGHNGAERRMREHALLRDAIEYIENQVPTFLDIDSDGDGRVDNVNFIIRGTPTAWSSLLWPHKWQLDAFDVRIHGKRVWEYNFNIESMTGVSVLAHEFAHSLGIPDFYRYSGNYNPVGVWDLMAANATPPQSISAHVKSKYTQWTQPIPLISQNGTFTLYPNNISFLNHAYRINSPFSMTDHFVVEYRSRDTGLLTDSAIPGSGLLIWRVNPSLTGNAQGHVYGDELYVYRPNGTLNANGNINQAFLSLESGRTQIHNMTNPSLFLANGQSAGFSIFNISSAGESITFDVFFGNLDIAASDESFECGTFDSHPWVMDTVRPWVITDETAFDGDFSAAAPALVAGESSRLEMSLNVDYGFLQFHYRTLTQSGDQLQFFINDELINSWSGTNNWSQFILPLPAGSYNFVWEFIKTNTTSEDFGSVWIDKIAFPEIFGSALFPARNVEHTNVDRDIFLTWDPPKQTQEQNPALPTLLGYNVIQNSNRLNESLITDQFYTITNSPGGDLVYWVVAVYETGDSGPSNTTDISLPFAIPTNLQASIVSNRVYLTWDFPYESPSILGFRVLRNGSNVTPLLVPADTKFFHDVNLLVGGIYTYQVRTIYESPNGVSDLSEPLEVHFVDTFDEVQPVYITALGTNHPNPFNPYTTISFSLGSQGTTPVHMVIYNVRGQRVRTLLDGSKEFSAGPHTTIWNGRDDRGNELSSGIYFYRMSAGSFVQTKKMILIK